MKIAGRQTIVDQGLPTLCVNPDLELRAGTLRTMLNCIQNGDNIGVVTAPLVGVDGEPDSASIRRLPSLGMASIYAVLGRFTPAKVRYNRLAPTQRDLEFEFSGSTGKLIEATTGALMLVHPDLRNPEDGIFDTDYWMYGEDLQLCHDARELGWRVAIVDEPPSLHIKGVSSGWPRSPASNRAFHDAMTLYFNKNLARGNLVDTFVRIGIRARLAFTMLTAAFARIGSREAA
jgi:GT2 family glycosyltransferase